MPKRIKTAIIHKLGGYTYEDIKKDRNIDIENAYNLGINDGQRKAITLLYNKVVSLYGLSKQEWIDKVWGMICRANIINHINNIKYER
jgi:hypothetical protein|nr:MAG TPA: hypothetical protein [Crassvirales sp.]